MNSAHLPIHTIIFLFTLPPLLQSLCWSTGSPALAAPPAWVAPRQLQYRVPGAGPSRRDGASVEGSGEI